MANELEITESKVTEWLEAFGYAKKTSPEERAQFIGIARELQLNPFKRELFLVVYGQGDNRTCSIITGYEVYLKRASRLNILDGWKVWTDGEGEKMKAYCRIMRKDWKEPFEWEVDFRECAQHKKDGALTRPWLQQPRFMLRKVCAAQAMRLCFPDEMGGMPYIGEEVSQEDELIDRTPTSPKDEATRVAPITEASRRPFMKRLHELYDAGTITKAQAQEWEKESNQASLLEPAEAMAAIAGITQRFDRWLKETEELDNAAEQAFQKDVTPGAETTEENQEELF